jgi:HK97 gp10 family phage protein
MSLSLNITITGIDQVKSSLDSIKEKVRSFVSDELRTISDELISEMKSTCPVDTGFLRDNIEESNSSSTAIQVSSRADYSIYVEMGTRYMTAQPFFYPAVDKISVEKIQGDFKTAVGL